MWALADLQIPVCHRALPWEGQFSRGSRALGMVSVLREPNAGAQGSGLPDAVCVVLAGHRPLLAPWSPLSLC